MGQEKLSATMEQIDRVFERGVEKLSLEKQLVLYYLSNCKKFIGDILQVEFSYRFEGWRYGS